MTGSIVTFRYRHDPIAGWGFAPEGESPIELFTEFTTGYLRLSGFGSGPVVGHIRKKGQFFVLHKPADRDEIKGCRLSHEDYARRGFDPFAVAIEALGALVPETTERPRGDGPWIAEGEEALGQAAYLFRRLSTNGRAQDYLSILPRGVAASAFPHTRFSHPSSQGAPVYETNEAVETKIDRLSARISKHTDMLQAHEEVLARLQDKGDETRQAATAGNVLTMAESGDTKQAAPSSEAPVKPGAGVTEQRSNPGPRWTRGLVGAAAVLCAVVAVAFAWQAAKDRAAVEAAVDEATRAVEDGTKKVAASVTQAERAAQAAAKDRAAVETAQAAVDEATRAVEDGTKKVAASVTQAERAAQAAAKDRAAVETAQAAVDEATRAVEDGTKKVAVSVTQAEQAAQAAAKDRAAVETAQAAVDEAMRAVEDGTKKVAVSVTQAEQAAARAAD